MPELHGSHWHEKPGGIGSQCICGGAYLGGEAPDKEVCETVAHAPPIKQPALLEGGQGESVPIWPPLGQHYMLSSYFAALVSYVN